MTRRCRNRSARGDRDHGRVGGRLHRLRVREIARSRSFTLALLLIGGAVSYFNEPIDDVLGLVWHPVVGQWTALDTFSRVPLWGLGIYIVFFGGMPYLTLQNLRRGMTRRQLWGWVGVLAVVDVALELPVLAGGIYSYYGIRAVADRRLPGVLDRHQRGRTASPCCVAYGCRGHVYRLACAVSSVPTDDVRRGGQCRGGMAYLQRTHAQLPRRCGGLLRH